MLKIFIVVMLFSPGVPTPLIQRVEVEDYQACLDRAEEVRAKAIELNERGGAISRFRVMAGCEFVSDGGDPL